MIQTSTVCGPLISIAGRSMTEKQLHVFSEVLPWLVLPMYRAFGTLSARYVPAHRQTRSALRFTTLPVVVVGFTLLFSSAANVGLLGKYFVSPAPLMTLVGVLVTWSGLLLAIWARYYAGEGRRARITFHVHHQIVRSGPMAYFRHPAFYSGILLGMAGTSLISGRWRCVLGFALVLSTFVIKTIKEESLFSKQFWNTYRAYRMQTGMLIPRPW